MQPPQRRWRRRLVVLVFAGGLLGAGGGYLASGLSVPGYDASAFLLVTPAATAPVATTEVQYAQAISQVVTNPTVLAAGGNAADLPRNPARLRADPSPNAPLIEIIVNAPTAGAAQAQAQAAAEAVVAYTDDRVDVLGFHAVVLAPAAAGEPAGLSLTAYLVAGGVMGAVLGGLIALLWGAPVVAVRDRPPEGSGEPHPETSDEDVLHDRPRATTVSSP